MDVVTFSVEAFDNRHASVLAVSPLVNDLRLTYLIAEYEKVRKYEPAGGYGAIIPKWFDYRPLDRYFLGEHERDGYWSKRGGIYLLGCQCGEVGCWPLLCHIRNEGARVIWEGFQQPHRKERDYSRFGPFVFEVAQNRSALLSLVSEMSERSPDLA